MVSEELAISAEKQEEEIELFGEELFAELKKLIPSCIEEDYRVGLDWKNEIMRLDAELVRRHREEAQAPDVETKLPLYIPPPKEVWSQPIVPKNALPVGSWAPGAIAAKMAAMSAPTNLPAAKPVGQLNANQLMGQAKAYPVGPLPAGSMSSSASSSAASSAVAVEGEPLPTTAKATSVSTAPSTAVNSGPSAPSAASDLKQMKAFVAQWSLEMVKTKLLLAKTTPAKRRWVMQHFRYVPASGKSPQETLEEYVQICEKNNLWKDAEMTTASWNQAAKRPAEAGADSAAKRPNLGSGAIPNAIPPGPVTNGAMPPGMMNGSWPAGAGKGK